MTGVQLLDDNNFVKKIMLTAAMLFAPRLHTGENEVLRNADVKFIFDMPLCSQWARGACSCPSFSYMVPPCFVRFYGSNPNTTSDDD